MPRKLTSITGLVIIVAIVLAVNLIAALLFSRAKFDMTKEELFTLADGTKEVLASVEENIRGTLFYSKKAIGEEPLFKLFADRVVQMLREYEAASKGKLAIEIIDPRPDTEEQEWADRYDLQSIPGPTGEPVYLGLVLKDESGHEEAVAFFNPERENTLEYDISKAIDNVAHPAKKKVGVLSPLNVLGTAPPPSPFANERDRPQPWTFIRELKNSYHVQKIEIDATQIPDDLDLLLVIHPKKLKPRTQYAIDQYVLKGGKALVFADAFCEADQASQITTDMQSRLQTDFLSEMPALFKAWGIEFWRGQLGADDPAAKGRSTIVADQDLACPIGDPRAGPIEKMYVWLRLGGENCNRDEIITGRLEDLIVATAAGIAKTSSSDKIAFAPLLTSSDKASTIEDVAVRFGLDPEQIRNAYKRGTTSIALAAKITGEFKTAFPDGRPAADSSEEGAPPGIDADPDQLKASRQPTTVIVVGDVDMISDRFSVSIEPFFNQQIVRRLNDNLVFASNAVENLAGSRNLIGLRSRGLSRRPFTRVQEIERRAAEKWGDEKQRLDEKLKEANERLLELQRGGGDKRILEQATVEEVEKLRAEQLETKRNLREVRLRLREDTERLGRIVKAINIALIPSLVVLVSIAIAVLKTVRRKQAAA